MWSENHLNFHGQIGLLVYFTANNTAQGGKKNLLFLIQGKIALSHQYEFKPNPLLVFVQLFICVSKYSF